MSLTHFRLYEFPFFHLLINVFGRLLKSLATPHDLYFSVKPSYLLSWALFTSWSIDLRQHICRDTVLGYFFSSVQTVSPADVLSMIHAPMRLWIASMSYIWCVNKQLSICWWCHSFFLDSISHLQLFLGHPLLHFPWQFMWVTVVSR